MGRDQTTGETGDAVGERESNDRQGKEGGRRVSKEGWVAGHQRGTRQEVRGDVEMGFSVNREEMKPRDPRRGQGGWKEVGTPAWRGHRGLRPADPGGGASKAQAKREEPQAPRNAASGALTPPSTSARAALTSPDPHGPVPVASRAAAAAVPQAPQNPPAPAKTFPINLQLRRGLRRHTLRAPAPPPSR